MPTIDVLRARARERIEQELLPRAKPARFWGGRGSGQCCSLCDRPILESEAEMELEHEGGPPGVVVRFHLQCQSIWDSVRQLQLSAAQWIAVERQLPPLHTTVEARLRLNESRSIILNVMRICDGETGPVVWLNATTNGQLPDHWHPVEWRSLPAQSAPATDRPVHRRA